VRDGVGDLVPAEPFDGADSVVLGDHVPDPTEKFVVLEPANATPSSSVAMSRNCRRSWPPGSSAAAADLDRVGTHRPLPIARVVDDQVRDDAKRR